MRTLVIETATPACSVALFAGDQLLAGRHETLGRGHAERLIPLISELPDKGRAERILVSLGPGSFTGTRIGIAAARALGLAWAAEVQGYQTLALVAAGAREAGPVLVAMTGGHGEWFVQPFGSDGQEAGPHQSLRPAEAAAGSDCETVVGSEAEALVQLRGWGRALPLLPDAKHALLLSPSSLLGEVKPLYGRAPDAKLSPAIAASAPVQ